MRRTICEGQAFPYLLSEGKVGYIAPWNIPISPVQYFNQILLTFNRYFASDVYFLPDLCMISTTYVAGTIKNIFKEKIERFVASDNAFSFMSSVKGTPAYWKQFLYDTVAMVKQIGIPSNFSTSSCADLRRENFYMLLAN